MKVETSQTVSEGHEKLKILFLGNSYNSLSVTCILSLIKAEHNVIIGEYNPTQKGLLKVIKGSVATHGVSFVVSKGIEFLWLQGSLLLQRLGVRRGHCASLAAVAEAHKLKAIAARDPNSSEFLQQIRNLKPDLIVVAAFSRILKAPLIAIPRLGCINVHPSLLPRYRGPEPYYWILFNKEHKTGVTIHYVDERIDSGNILMQREFELEPSETELTLQNKCNVVAANLLGEAVLLLASGEASSIPQNETDASYYSFPPKGQKRVRSYFPFKRDRATTNASL